MTHHGTCNPRLYLFGSAKARHMSQSRTTVPATNNPNNHIYALPNQAAVGLLRRDRRDVRLVEELAAVRTKVPGYLAAGSRRLRSDVGATADGAGGISHLHDRCEARRRRKRPVAGVAEIKSPTTVRNRWRQRSGLDAVAVGTRGLSFSHLSSLLDAVALD